MEKLIDFHTHNPNPHHECIYVLDPRDEHHNLDAFKFCYGLHPWFIQNVDFKTIEQNLSQYIQHPNFFALGELGLDRSLQDFDIQKDIFLKQLELANQLEVNTLVIHCVRAYSDILGIFKAKQPKQRIIFHDFNGDEQTLQQLLKWDSYFSVGSSIMNSQRKITKTLASIPKERLFLETDDQNTISLEAIYSQAASLLNLSLEDLTAQIRGNFTQFSS